MATKLVPTNSPPTYRVPAANPYAEPTPAVDNTPGPGVISKKKTAAAKVSTYSTSPANNRATASAPGSGVSANAEDGT